VISGPPPSPQRDETPDAPRRLSVGRARLPVFAEVPNPETPAEAPAADTSVALLREFERTGRPEPFEAFMRRHASMVYATCLKVTRDPHDAEDATQATFLTLASKSRLNGEIRQPEAWLRKVAHRLSLDLIRSKKRRINRENLRSEMNSEAAPLDSHDHANKGEIKGILNEELAKLPASYRMPLILHYFGGLSRDEMASQLKLKPSTLGVRLHRAREQLRRKLAARGILLPTVALTALLTDVVHQSVCGHIMSKTAQQASAIAMGHATVQSAAPMFAASTGVDSIGSLLGLLAHGKFKLLLSALVVGMAISMSSAQVRSLIPAALRSIVPSWRVPSFSLPRLDLDVPMPRFSAGNATPEEIESPMLATTGQFGSPARAALMQSFIATVGAAQRVGVASQNLVADVRKIVPKERPAIASSASKSTWTLPRTFALSSSTRKTSAEAIAAAAKEPSASRSVSTSARSDDVRAASESSVAAGDLWNSVLPSSGGMGGGGGSVPPASLSSIVPPPAPLPNKLPARLVAPVTGAAPALQDSTGHVAGDAAPGSKSSTPNKPSKTDAQAAAVTSVPATLKTAQTIVFSGTGENHGGYASDAWKPTSLNRVSSLDHMSTTPSTPPGFSFNYPSVPGTSLSVNGARATIHAAAGLTDAPASIEFVDTSTTAIPALPKEHHFIGVWQLEVQSDFDSIDLLVHYDDLRAARLGLNERILKLWVSDGKEWSLLWKDPTFGRDIEQNLMWVTAGSDVKFFAASAPEPATLAVVLGAIGIASRRRRIP
jgi:RNA polymerase sigma factor (sigma-70 family)